MSLQSLLEAAKYLESIESDGYVNNNVNGINNNNSGGDYVSSSSNSSTYGGGDRITGSPVGSNYSNGSGGSGNSGSGGLGGGHLLLDPNLPISSQFHDYVLRNDPSNPFFSVGGTGSNPGGRAGSGNTRVGPTTPSTSNRRKSSNGHSRKQQHVLLSPPGGSTVLLQYPVTPPSNGSGNNNGSISGNNGVSRNLNGKGGFGSSDGGGRVNHQRNNSISDSGRGGGGSDRDSVSSSRHRELHKTLEKNRRAHLRSCFEELKKELPKNELGDKKTSHINIIHMAIKYIMSLKKNDTELEHEMQRLAKLKIRNQQHLARLRESNGNNNPMSLMSLKNVGTQKMVSAGTKENHNLIISSASSSSSAGTTGHFGHPISPPLVVGKSSPPISGIDLSAKGSSTAAASGTSKRSRNSASNCSIASSGYASAASDASFEVVSSSVSSSSANNNAGNVVVVTTNAKTGHSKNISMSLINNNGGQQQQPINLVSKRGVKTANNNNKNNNVNVNNNQQKMVGQPLKSYSTMNEGTLIIGQHPGGNIINPVINNPINPVGNNNKRGSCGLSGMIPSGVPEIKQSFLPRYGPGGVVVATTGGNGIPISFVSVNNANNVIANDGNVEMMEQTQDDEEDDAKMTIMCEESFDIVDETTTTSSDGEVTNATIIVGSSPPTSSSSAVVVKHGSSILNQCSA